ncbi:unnamed protein product [Polarella glacialis]|uniref:Uncharacterized protein n=1 Tax=Polarella glacialis TaxID=89957 RepID=A0A813KVQ8_POLGL|nr:unnamed protein product [Polarella glacialis]
MAVVCGPLALRLTFGTHYFASWTEEDEQQELGRLYRERGWGESFVLSGWRMRRVALFVFDIVVWMWLRYYLDFYLDVQAMYIFWQHSNFWFLLGNFGGIVLGLLWTAVEFYKILRDGEREDYLPGGQVLIVGLLIPMAGMHVTYLSVLSLFTGDKHRFLFISTLAESVLESSVSAFVQTYAVVFSTLSLADKVDLYSSIALSFISIGYAFSSLDKYDGGELLVKLPGLCRSSSAKWWAVFIFRISEVTSRATSLALFQCIWSWGIVSVMAADTVIVVVLSAIFQWSRGRKYGQTGQKLMRDNLVYALPSSICLMTPMLEKDSPMTLPPEMYYSLRVLELAGMVALAGWKIRWDVDVAREEFKDDAIIVVSFALSTVLMVLLCVVLRQFVAVRTLLEAPMDMWHMRPFNVTQQVLRNRILGADSADTCSKSRSGHTWHSEQRRIVAQIQRAPQRASSLIYADLASGLPKDMAKAEWDARFLSAKVTCCLEQSLQSLADTFASLQSGSKVFASRSSSFTRTPSKKKTLQHSNMSPQNSVVPALDHGVLRAGTLVHIRGPGGGLTNDESRVVMRWAGDSVDQKFVVESADEECVGFRGKLSEPILSGGHVRLRALQTNRMLGLAPLHHSNSALPLLDEEGGQALMESWDLETRKYSRPGSGVEPDTLFSFMLWREEEYRSARRFALSVKPLNKGTLEVGSFRPNVCGTDDFVESGWRIAAINGHAATPDDVEQILAQARQELEEDGVSENPESHLARSNTVGAHVLAARSDSMTSGKSRSSTAKFRVCFEKAYGNDMAIHLGDRVVLRAAAVPGGAAAGAGVGFGLEIGHGPSGLEPGSGTRALRGSADTDPLPLTVEPAEIGSRDDPPLYSWAAGEIRRNINNINIVTLQHQHQYQQQHQTTNNKQQQHQQQQHPRRKADAGRLSASLAEKCRVAIMVAW